MRIAVTGATGFIGRPLVEYISGLGYECIVLTRDITRAATLGFPSSVRLSPLDDIADAEAVIHLAGESVVGYWTPRKRRAILASRVDSTNRLVAAMRKAKTRPHTFLSASAVGFYGSRPGELLEEDAGPDPKAGFRSVVCRAWEEAANVADTFGIRVVNLRIGNVFDPAGGYLGGLLPVYRWLGAWTFGEPQGAIPWISRHDLVRLIGFALANERWYGPVNLVAPHAATHQELAETMAAHFGRTGVRTMPKFLTRAVLGEFATAITEDQRVVPAKALSAGFDFHHPRFPEWWHEATGGNERRALSAAA